MWKIIDMKFIIKINLQICLSIALSFLMVGCATQNTSPYFPAQSLVEDSSKGIIWVYWKQDWAPKGVLSNILHPLNNLDTVNVYVDGEKVGVIYPNTHAIMALNTGRRRVSLGMPDPKLDTNNEISITSTAEKSVVLQFENSPIDSPKSHIECIGPDQFCTTTAPDYIYHTYVWKNAATMTDEGKTTKRSFLFTEK